MIKKVRLSSKDETAVIISADGELDRITVWDIQDNQETSSMTIKKPYVVVFDHLGKPYIISKNVHFADLNCSTTAYDFDDVDLLKLVQLDQDHDDENYQYTDQEIGAGKGNKFDGKNHNYLVLQNYLALPFSYMSFALKDHFEK